jgi:hypothetical protein
MTWLSYSTRAITLFVVLPLVLSKFDAAEVVLWFLFSTIISLQGLVDFGFRQTFSRFVSYAYCGAASIMDLRNNDDVVAADAPSNKPLLHGIVSSMKQIYIFLTVALLIMMIVFGTWALLKPVAALPNENEGWVCWVIVVAVTCLSFYGKIYQNFLEGLNKIAVLRRVETATSLCSIASSIVVMIWFPSLLNLVIVNQFWVAMIVFRDRFLCRRIENGLYVEVSGLRRFDAEMFQQVWQPAWRSGLSGIMSAGITNLTGIIYAQFVASPAAASYLLALRLINVVKDVSMAPFYSKLPVLSMLRVRGDMSSFVRFVKRGMFLSHFVFVCGFIATGLFMDALLRFIHSDVAFVSNWLWILLGIAFFMHRFGAMHIQVYLTTNHIISHIADGVAGLIIILCTLLLVRLIEIYAVPVGMIIGYATFYCWYAAVHSYRSMNVSFLRFERNSSLLPAVLLIIYSILMAHYS